MQSLGTLSPFSLALSHRRTLVSRYRSKAIEDHFLLNCLRISIHYVLRKWNEVTKFSWVNEMCILPEKRKSATRQREKQKNDENWIKNLLSSNGFAGNWTKISKREGARAAKCCANGWKINSPNRFLFNCRMNLFNLEKCFSFLRYRFPTFSFRGYDAE